MLQDVNLFDKKYYNSEKGELNLSNLGITDDDLKECITPLLKNHPEITKLNLSGNKLGGKHQASNIVLTLLSVSNLTSLNLRNNVFSIGSILIINDRHRIPILEMDYVGVTNSKAFRINNPLSNANYARAKNLVMAENQKKYNTKEDFLKSVYTDVPSLKELCLFKVKQINNKNKTNYVYKNIDDEKLIDVFSNYQEIKGGKQLNGISSGICFGSALCHGIFTTIGKGEWWNAVLAAITDWDREPESLANLIQLPGSPQTYSLNTLIQMAGEFLLQHKTIDLTAKEFELADNANQRNLLVLGGSFQVITESGKKAIQDKLTLLVHEDQDLEKFINKFQACYNDNEVVCLLYRQLHTCTLRCENGVYFFNGNRGESSPIKETSRIWDLTRQSGSKLMGIDILSFDKKIDSGLVELSEELTKAALNRIDVTELRTISRVAPQCIPQLLDKVNSIEKEEQLAQALLDSEISTSPNNLRLLISKAPNALPQLLNLVKTKPELQSNFVKAFASKYKGFTGLDLLTTNASDSLPQLFELAKDLPLLLNSLIEAYKESTAFLLLIQEAPAHLPAFFKLCENSEKLQENLAKIMSITLSKQNVTPVHALAICNPEYFLYFLHLVSQSPLLIKTFSSILGSGYSGWPLLHQIIKNAKNCLPQLIALAKNNKEIMQAIHDAMTLEIKNENESIATTMNGFELVSRYASDFQLELNDLYAVQIKTNLNVNSIFYQKYSLPNCSLDITKEDISFRI